MNTVNENLFINDDSSVYSQCKVKGDIYVTGTNILISECEINGNIIFDNAYNCVMLKNKIYGSVMIRSSNYITVAENASLSYSKLDIFKSKNILVNDNVAFVTSVTDCDKVYGNDIKSAAEVKAGADTSLLAPIDNRRFVGMRPRDDIADIIGQFNNGSYTIIPPGVYNVPLKDKHHLTFRDVKDYTLYAYGVEFIFEDYTFTAIYMNNCENVFIKGLTMDYKLVANTQGTVIENNGDSVTLKIDKGYPALLHDNHYYNTENGLYAEGYRVGFDRPYRDLWFMCERISDDIYRLNGKSDLLPDNKVIFRGKFAHVNLFQFCSSIKYEDVTLLGGSGFGFMENNGGDSTILNRIVFTPGPRPADAVDDRLISVCDATHSTNMRHGIKVYNSFFEKMTDDATNVNGTFGNVTDYIKAESKVMFGASTTNYTGHCPPFKKGDTVLISTMAGKLLTRSIAQADSIGDSVIIDNDFDMPDEPVIIENASSNGDGFVYENCVVQNNRSRGLLIKAPNGRISNCTLKDNGMSAILIRPETADNWGECGFVWNVLVENNLIIESGFFSGRDLHSPINVSVDADATSDQAYQNQRNVRLIGNVIRDRYSKYALYIDGCYDAEVTGNDFGTRIGYYAESRTGEVVLNPLAVYGDDTAPCVSIKGSTNVRVYDNIYPPSVERKVDIDEHCVGITGNDII